MEEVFVKYSTAVIAKDKGYPQEQTKVSQPYYNHKGELNGDCLDYIKTLLAHRKGECSDDDLSKVSNIRAMSQSLLQKWLRDVHNIWIDVEYNGAGVMVYIHNKGVIDSRGAGLFETYESALESGLHRAMKLIK